MTVRVQDRVIGRWGRGSDGPLVIVIAGMHGNEPAGLTAATRVLEKLAASSGTFSGRLLVLAGNRPALARGQRYVEEDLNRIWFPDRLREDDLKTCVPPSVETVEQREILHEVRTALDDFKGTAYFLDLHTTSAPGAPFSVLADTLSNREVAQRLPGTMVLGLEEHLDGTFLNYVNDLGHIAIGFEGGQHSSAGAIDAQELALWKTLVMAGCVRAGEMPNLERLARSIEASIQRTPRIVEIRHRHHVLPDDQFQMKPGFQNLQRINRGQALARDHSGDILAREDGRVLMPLYQSQGNDGFFIVREVRSFWLVLAAWMRRMRLDRILPLMPGVESHPTVEDSFVINSAVARWYVVEVCHLLGFRRKRVEGGRLVVSRRREVPVRDM